MFWGKRTAYCWHGWEGMLLAWRNLIENYGRNLISIASDAPGHGLFGRKKSDVVTLLPKVPGIYSDILQAKSYNWAF